MNPVDIALITLAPCAVARYLEYVHAVGPMLLSASAVADEQFVARPDGGGWVSVDVHMGSVHVLSVGCPVEPGEWLWAGPMGRGGES